MNSTLKAFAPIFIGAVLVYLGTVAGIPDLKNQVCASSVSVLK